MVTPTSRLWLELPPASSGWERRLRWAGWGMLIAAGATVALVLLGGLVGFMVSFWY